MYVCLFSIIFMICAICILYSNYSTYDLCKGCSRICPGGGGRHFILDPLLQNKLNCKPPSPSPRSNCTADFLLPNKMNLLRNWQKYTPSTERNWKKIPLSMAHYMYTSTEYRSCNSR